MCHYEFNDNNTNTYSLLLSTLGGTYHIAGMLGRVYIWQIVKSKKLQMDRSSHEDNKISWQIMDSLPNSPYFLSPTFLLCGTKTVLLVSQFLKTILFGAKTEMHFCLYM